MILFLAIPQQFYYLITLLSVGCSYGCSLISALMLRPSIARELAVDKDSRFTRENIEKAARSSQAPGHVAKPIVKWLLKREARRREETGGVQIVTVVDEVRSDADDVSGRQAGTEAFSERVSFSDAHTCSSP